MKKILFAALLWPLIALAQSYPSPTYQNLTVLGTTHEGAVAITGGSISGISPPIPVASGGTNSASASGTALDNITGFASTGFMSRTGAGAYSFTASTGSGGNVVLSTSPSIASPTVTGAFTATGLVTTADLATQAANTILANGTGSTASPTAISVPSCSAATNALQWTSGTGFACNSAINAATLGGTAAASYALLASPTFTGTPAAPTAALGTNTTQLATTAFVSNHSPCLQIDDYGGTRGGTVDNSTAWANVIAAQTSSSNVCVSFGPAVYYFASSPTFTTANHGSITIKGQGIDVTRLKFASGVNGPQITYYSGDSSASVHDLSITTAGANTGTGLSLIAAPATYGTGQNAQTNIYNVTLRGDDGYAASDYWATGVSVSGVRFANFVNVMVEGGGGCSAVSGYGCYSTNSAIGFNIFGTSSLIPVQFNFVNCGANYVAEGIVYGTYTEGIIVQNCEFVGGKYGVYVPNASVGPDQLTVQGSNFNVYPQAIYDGVGVQNTTISNNTFLVPPSSQGVDLLHTNGFSITGNSFQSVNGSPSSNNGVVVENSTIGGVITGNVFLELAGAIWEKTGTGGVNVQSNSYYGNTLPNVINSSSSACPATTTANCNGGGSQ